MSWQMGLSSYEEKVYRSLLVTGAVTATELSDISGVPKGRIYDVLNNLKARKLIETQSNDPKQYVAVQPETAVDILLAEKTSTRQKRSRNAGTSPRYPTTRSVSSSGSKRSSAGPGSSSKRPKTRFRSVWTQVTSGKIQNPTDQKAIESSVEAAGEDVPPVRHRRHLYRARTLPTPFVAIVDRTGACFAPHDNSVNQYGVLVDDYTLAYVFHWYFQTALWEVWEVVTERTPQTPTSTSTFDTLSGTSTAANEDAIIEAVVVGYDTETRESVELTGRVTGIDYAGSHRTDGPVPLARRPADQCDAGH